MGRGKGNQRKGQNKGKNEKTETKQAYRQCTELVGMFSYNSPEVSRLKRGCVCCN